MRADRTMAEGAAANQRIDLAAPLRSVRRTDPPPRYKADLKSGPVRHPGAVPFVWEQRPGQPKSVRTRRPPPPTPPRGSSPLTRPEVVDGGGGSPFHDALGDLGPEAELHGVAATFKEAAAAPVPEVTNEVRQQWSDVTAALVPRKNQEDGGEEEDEERFSDALDTLSRTESLAMNCSVSGLSGAPDAASSGAEPGPGARGFMMDRFLPAAHAVAVGSPQYTFRKAGGATGNSGRDHARAAAVKVTTGNGDDHRVRRAPVQLPHQHLPPNYLSCTYPRREEHDDDEEDDDDEDNYDVQSTKGFSAKGCGLLPGLCVKTSLLLLNPVPAMKGGKPQVRGRGRQFPSKGPGSLARGSQNKTTGCDSKAQSWEDVYKYKLEQKYLGQGDDGRSKLTSESNQLTFWSDSPTGNGSSPFHHSMAGGTSPYHSYAAMSTPSKANGSFGTGDRDERARDSYCSGSLGRDHDRGSLLGSDQSSFKGSSSMSSGLDRTGHEDSMDHRGDIDPEIGHLGLLLDPKAALNANVNYSQPQGQPMLCRNPGMETLDDGKHLTHGAHLEAPVHLEENSIAKKEVMPLQSLLPLPVPKSPSESWLSRTLPFVASKPPVPSFLGIRVQSKKQAPWASLHPKENDKKPPRTRQILFADVVERPTSLDSEI